MTGFGARLLNHHFAVFTKLDSANGAMSVLKGSHKSGSLPYIKSKTNQNGYTNLIPSDINKLQTDLKRGSSLIQ